MRKRILSVLLAVMFLFTGLPGTAWAVGEGNMEAGGGQTETVTGDSFWNGDWGIRFCVVDVASQTVVSATYDAANKSSGYENYKHYGKPISSTTVMGHHLMDRLAHTAGTLHP